MPEYLIARSLLVVVVEARLKAAAADCNLVSTLNKSI
jgi:hypothetical protein